jgi:hypothetical protein
LQQRPGNKTGSSQFGFGHSFLMLRHSVRPAILRFFCTCQSANNNNKIRKEKKMKIKKKQIFYKEIIKKQWRTIWRRVWKSDPSRVPFPAGTTSTDRHDWETVSSSGVAE